MENERETRNYNKGKKEEKENEKFHKGKYKEILKNKLTYN